MKKNSYSTHRLKLIELSYLLIEQQIQRFKERNHVNYIPLLKNRSTITCFMCLFLHFLKVYYDMI